MASLTEVREPERKETTPPKIESSKLPPPPYADSRLFSTVLLEVDNSDRSRRKWTAATSIVVQCFVLGLLVIVPLMFTDVLPKQQLLTFLVAPPPPPPPPPPAAAPVQVVRQVQSDLMNGQLRTPSRIPQKIEMIKEAEAPPPLSNSGGVIGGVPGGIPGGQLGGVIGGIISSTSNAPSLPKFEPPKRIRVSQGVIAGRLIRKVEPLYPMLARQARIQGDVILNAVIAKDGTIQNLQVVSGHPMLIQPALEAVQQWRYRPYLVSGEPVEVEVRITVTFRLSS